VVYLKLKTLASLLGGILCLFMIGPIQAQQASQFEFNEVDDRVYSARFVTHRNMIVVTDQGVIVTDPINDMAAKMMMVEIQKLTDLPVKLVIYSHNHWDHISGARIFKEQGAKIIQHELSAAKTRPSPNVVPADETFSGQRYDVTLGNQVIELHYLGPSHGSGLVVMRLPERKILHTIDVVTPGRVAFRNMPDFFPQDWIKMLEETEKLDFDRIIPGHDLAEAPRSAVIQQREYVEDLTQAIRKAAEIVENPFDFQGIHDLVKPEM
jgi:glyoxylase-like metal-dependent hydrolase (beta-lactamase superfamily II)